MDGHFISDACSYYFSGGSNEINDSGLSITTWELFIGSLPPLSNEKWIEYFNLYKKIPEYKEQNFNMTLNEFKFIFGGNGHRQWVD